MNINDNSKTKVYIGISGGVDSAVAAALLIEQGYDVTGVFMKNWSGIDYGITDDCPWEEDQRISQEVCDHLEIEHRTYNFEKEYRALVMSVFFKEYELGNTPNPDVLCNKFIKFDAFLNKCLANGADIIATGHYAGTKDGKLVNAKDDNKDQTYFLSRVKKEQLEKVLFPLSDLTKPEIRDLAKKYNLPNAMRKDSQGICFVGKIDLGDFLKSKIKEKVGDFIDIDTNEIVGQHNGVYFYTQGQRKGIKIGGLSDPYFVCKKNVEKNIIYLAKGKKNPALWKSKVVMNDLELIDNSIDLLQVDNLEAMIRYRGERVVTSTRRFATQNSSFCDLGDSQSEFGKVYEVVFEKAQWAPAPGQDVVFYSGKQCLGAGRIVGG